jgi:hypothetical protein
VNLRQPFPGLRISLQRSHILRFKLHHLNNLETGIMETNIQPATASKQAESLNRRMAMFREPPAQRLAKPVWPTRAPTDAK